MIIYKIYIFIVGDQSMACSVLVFVVLLVSADLIPKPSAVLLESGNNLREDTPLETT